MNKETVTYTYISAAKEIVFTYSCNKIIATQIQIFCQNWNDFFLKISHQMMIKFLHMCFDGFLLAFESRDLSQADKSIKRVLSFPNWVMSSKSSFSVSQGWGLNFLKTKFCQSSQIYLSPEKTEKTVYFLSLETFEW